jgi:hypothetical protein
MTLHRYLELTREQGARDAANVYDEGDALDACAWDDARENAPVDDYDGPEADYDAIRSAYANAYISALEASRVVRS